MDKINVIYWSQTGNTEAMAEAIGNGIKEGGKEAIVTKVGEIKVEDLKNEKIMALGCPSMGCEVLEESEMEPFIDELEKIIKGKTVVLFGSYGWGDGEWMRNWVEKMQSAGANVLNNEGLICQETPDDAIIDECIQIGKQIALI